MPDRSAKGGKTSVCKRWAKNKFFFYIAVIISIISDKQSPPKKKDKQICTLMKLLIKRIAELHKIAAKKVSDDTDLEKIKLLFNQTVPTVEKAVRELEKYLREYSRLADPDDLENMSARVEAAS